MKFIMINGPGGAGKTTLAKKLHKNKELSVLVLNYLIRRMINGFKENRDKSREIMFNLTYGIVEQALESGIDVIVDQKTHDDFSGNSIIDRYVSLAEQKGATTYEIILTVDKENAMERIRQRGFSEGGILNEENLEENVNDFLKKMNDFMASRDNAIIVNTSNMTEEEVLEKVLEIIKD